MTAREAYDGAKRLTEGSDRADAPLKDSAVEPHDLRRLEPGVWRKIQLGRGRAAPRKSYEPRKRSKAVRECHRCQPGIEKTWDTRGLPASS